MKDNTLPTSLYQAKRIIQRLGFNYNSIHACYNACVLFRGDLKEATICPKCSPSRFFEALKNVLVKVLCHSPMIPWLKRMFKCSSLVELMSWHRANISVDGLVCSVCDSKAWKCVNNTWPEFIVESWNIRLGELICRLINKSFYLVGPS